MLRPGRPSKVCHLGLPVVDTGPSLSLFIIVKARLLTAPLILTPLSPEAYHLRLLVVDTEPALSLFIIVVVMADVVSLPASVIPSRSSERDSVIRPSGER